MRTQAGYLKMYLNGLDQASVGNDAFRKMITRGFAAAFPYVTVWQDASILAANARGLSCSDASHPDSRLASRATLMVALRIRMS